MTDANLSDVAAAGARTLWLVFEAAEVIELKRILLDRDAEGTEAFFQRVVSPWCARPPGNAAAPPTCWQRRATMKRLPG